MRRLGEIRTALLYYNVTLRSPSGHFQTPSMRYNGCALDYLALLKRKIPLGVFFQCSRYPRGMGMVTKCRAGDSAAIDTRIDMIYRQLYR